MSSRDTFITNYLYNKDAAKALEEALAEWGDVQNNGHYLSGVIHSGCWHHMDIHDDCIRALQAVGYNETLLLGFQLVIINDDSGIVAMAMENGTYTEYVGCRTKPERS